MRAVVLGLSAAALLSLVACGNPAATPEREETAATTTEGSGDRAETRGDSGGDSGSERADRRGGRERGAAEDGDSADATPAPALAETHEDGAPMWASNRRRSAAEAAQRQFERNGADFGATTRAAYIDRAHEFIQNPPAGVQTAERRNGDRLIYDPRGNVFAVVTRDGAPRTLFKPEDGAAYWREQQERNAGGGGSRRAERRAADG